MTASMTELDSLSRLERLLQQICDISAAQRNLILGANTEALNRNLERRQVCLDELSALPEPETLLARSSKARALLACIQGLEEENLALMDGEMSNFRDKMRKNTDARKMQAYSRSYFSGPQGEMYNKKQ